MTIVVLPVQNNIEDCLNRILSIRVKYAPTNNEIYLDQAEAVLSTINARLAASDIKLIFNGMLQSMETGVRNFSGLLVQVENNGIGHLPNLATPIEQLKSYIYQIPVIESSVETRSLRDAIEKARRSLIQQTRALKDEREKLSQQWGIANQHLQKTNEMITTASSMIDEFKTSHEQLLEELNDAFTTEQKQRSNQFATEQESHQNLVEQEIQPFVSQFEDQIAATQEKTGDLISKLGNDISKAISTQTSKVENSVNEWVAQSKQVIDELNEFKQQAADLAGAIATTTHAGAYKKTADLEETRALTWRKIAMGAFILLVVAAISEFILEFIRPVSTFDWSIMSSRLIVTAAIAAVAGYAAKQASTHAKNGQVNRRMELIMRSIDPYLQSLEPTARQKIKEELAQPLFSFKEVASGLEGREESGWDAETILKLISTLVTKGQ